MVHWIQHLPRCAMPDCPSILCVLYWYFTCILLRRKMITICFHYMYLYTYVCIWVCQALRRLLLYEFSSQTRKKKFNVMHSWLNIHNSSSRQTSADQISLQQCSCTLLESTNCKLCTCNPRVILSTNWRRRKKKEKETENEWILRWQIKYLQWLAQHNDKYEEFLQFPLRSYVRNINISQEQCMHRCNVNKFECIMIGRHDH